MLLSRLRQEYHRRICQEVARIRRDNKKGIEYPNSADSGNERSIKIAWGLFKRLGCENNYENLSGQSAGDRFEVITKSFLEDSFKLLNHLRPGKWIYSTKETVISKFNQYQHLAHLAKFIKKNKELSSTLGGDYLIKPDIVVARHAVSDDEINLQEKLVSGKEIAKLTPFRDVNYKKSYPLLHASISCKWTIRSDRSQNTRTEALNLIRNRKGKLPHIVAVIAEPLPTRIASLALGTGDLDCVYHYALNELQESITELKNEDQLDMLTMLIEGRRLRDISDLPFDLAG